MAEALAANLIRFSRYLRSRGLAIVPETSALMLRATQSVGLGSRDDAYYAMRSVTVTRPDELVIFDEAFRLFFGEGGAFPTPPPPESRLEVDRGGAHPVALPEARPSAEELELVEQVGASAIERLGNRDFSELEPDQLATVKRLLAHMVWEPSLVRSRRWVASRGRGPQPDRRRSLRGLVGPTGDLLPLVFSERRRRRRPLIVLADVSGSMERYVEMFLYFVHAARDRLGRLEAFVFSTRLTRITRQLEERDVAKALAQVGSVVQDWSGGTKIGEALEQFNLRWGRRVTRGGPIGLIISDGWDCGDPELLAKEMAKFSRTMHRVVWLNPLAGRAGYEPTARGMQAVLPHVHDFLPAASVADLAEVIDLLESIPARV